MEKEFEGSRYFLNIPADIAHDPELNRGIAGYLFGEIWSMLNVTGSFYMSNAKLAEKYHCDEKTIRRGLALLEKKQLIVRQNVYKEGTKQVVGRKIFPGSKVGTYLPGGYGQELPEGPGVDARRVGAQMPGKKNSLNRASNIADLSLPSRSEGYPQGGRGRSLSKSKSKTIVAKILHDPVIDEIRKKKDYYHDDLFHLTTDFVGQHPSPTKEEINDFVVRSAKTYLSPTRAEEIAKERLG